MCGLAWRYFALPCRERDAFLALLRRSPKLSRELSATPWTFIDDMEVCL